jgi:hypothetical protein
VHDRQDEEELRKSEQERVFRLMKKGNTWQTEQMGQRDIPKGKTESKGNDKAQTNPSFGSFRKGGRRSGDTGRKTPGAIGNGGYAIARAKYGIDDRLIGHGKLVKGYGH